MNWTLFKSIHFVFATLIAAGFVAWISMIDASIGTREGSDVEYILWSGWVAFGLMLIAMAYCARKYMHKRGYSSEFKRRVPVKNLEAAESRLNVIRADVAKGLLTSRGEVEQQARRALQEERVNKVLLVDVKDGDTAAGDPQFVLTTRPPEIFGRMTKWLHAHIYYGLASGVLVWVHGGGTMGLASPLGFAMTVLTFIVLLTGVIGWILFAVGPSWMTRNETDMNFEETFVLRASLGDKIEEQCKKLEDEPQMLAKVKRVARAKRGVAARIEKTLAELSASNPDATDLLRDIMVLIGQRHRMRVGNEKLYRIKFWMNLWRAIHIPASLALIGAVLVHILSVWWY